MKPIKKRWLGLAIAPCLLALMSVVSPAYATDYTCDGGSNPVPANVTGSVNIALISENCVIDHDVTATSLITIQTTAFAGAGSIKTKKLTSINSDVIVKAPNNSITTKQIKAGWNVNIEGGTITVDGTITGHTDQTSANHFPADPSYHGSILLRALGNISTKTIRMEGGLGHASVKSGGIQIDANMSGAPVEFLIGGPSANGVDGDLITISSIGCNTIPTHMEGGVRITNGLSTSQGGIRLIDMSNIKVRSTQSRAGLIILNAQNGTLTLPTGKLNAEGMPGQMGGYIFLAGKTIDMQDGTIISTNQDADAAASDHHINITAETIKFRGTEGLKVLADGNGLTGYGLIYIAPQNAVFSRSNNQLNGLDWTFDYLSANGLLKLDGTGDGSDTAPLLVRADGNGTEVDVAGYPINFIGGDVTLRARGATEHNIYLGYLGAFTNKQGMEVSITGKFVVDADGKPDDGSFQAAGGKILVSTDQTLLNASERHLFSANGSDSGGDSGTINIKHGSVVLTTKAKITANGAADGTGNSIISDPDTNGPQAIRFASGSNDIVLGTGNGHFNFSAKGGTALGNGGGVLILPDPIARIRVRDSLGVDASAVSENSDGGLVKLGGKATRFLPNDALRQNVSIKATGGSQLGAGGKVIIPAAEQFDVNAAIVVDSGDTASSNIFGGSIRLNDHLCRRWKTGFAWPTSYWNCANPDNPTTKDLIPATVAFNISQHALEESNKVVVYVFKSAADFNTFWSDSVDALAGGITFKALLSDAPTQYLYTAPYQEGNAGGLNIVTYTDDQYREVSAHEQGHVFDTIFNIESKNSSYALFALRDLANFDYANIGATKLDSIKRLPCALTPDPAHPNEADPLHFFPGSIPFNGVMNLFTNEPVCIGGVLNPADWSGTESNSQVIIRIESGIWKAPPDLWTEAYTQVFAYQAVGNKGARPVTDKVLDNGFMSCMKAWASELQAAGHGGGPASPGSCSVALPWVYTPGPQ